MNKVIYNMTEDILLGLSPAGFNNIIKTINIISDLNEDDYNDLCIGIIDDDIMNNAKKLQNERDATIQKLDDLMHFYYPTLKSYEIQYDKDKNPTGEVIVCLE